MKDILESCYKRSCREIDIRKKRRVIRKKLELLEKMKALLESCYKRSCREIDIRKKRRVIRKKAIVIRKNEGHIRI